MHLFPLLLASAALAWQAKDFHMPSSKELQKKLTPEQYEVTQKAGTEPPFHNAYWHNEQEGIYVDVVSGEPLFSSKDKFDSGTGWPSFSRPLVAENIVTKPDHELPSKRTEVRSRYANSHLGHVFDDGPAPTHLRYCMNSAALRFVPKDELKKSYPEFASSFASKEKALFAAGCFWGTEEFFRKVPGVLSTRVGYAGGKKDKPTYEKVSEGSTGHAETVEITFDPSQVSYEKLLDQFFKMHDPTTANRQGNDVGTQYRSAIFYENAAQKAEAEKFMAKVEKSKAWKGKLSTELAPASNFYPAEDYHQHYLVKHPGGYDNHYLRKISF